MIRLLSLLRLFTAALLLALASTAQGQTLPTDSAEVARLRSRLAPYMRHVGAQPDWLVSRLQMNWTTHASQTYVRGEQFDHVGTERADVPTIKTNGSRSTASDYRRPALEDIRPYDDDSLGRVTYINKVSGVMEPTSPARTGCNIANVNRQILGIARDAAHLYALTADSRYRDSICLPVLDTFLRGLAATRVPLDLNHGHQQTLMGLTTFEVIHEEAVSEVTEAYRYLATRNPAWDEALRHWADVITRNGVPHNNWNLFQADFILKLASTLADDSLYADRRGRQYYTRVAVEGEGLRQWGIARLCQLGFGPEAVWYEGAGYATNMVRDLAVFANRMDRDYGIDLFSSLPVLKRAIWALPQYLMPNRMAVGFGDTHPNYLTTSAADALEEYARRHQLDALADSAAQLRHALQPSATEAEVTRWATPRFSAPNVSWYVLREGMDPRHGLMASLNGSLGNHQHANGISLELYGRGYVLAPDAGIGQNLYSGQDYAEYYSQMPAHNTVVVDGVSSYPVMMSQHAFSVRHEGETRGATGRYVTVDFLEPETQSDQRRTVAVVRTSATSGYYIDVFRSRRRDGRDRFHDYFYHNLGQQLTLSGDSLQPTDELAFAGGHLYAYSYLYDQRKTSTRNDVQARFTTHAADGRDIDMQMWMRGDADRDIFTALAPPNLEYERMPGQPYDIDAQPTLTYVARQQGEAWQHPFVAVFAPSDSAEPSDIASVSFFQPEGRKRSHDVGILIRLRDGQCHRIIVTEEGELQLNSAVR